MEYLPESTSKPEYTLFADYRQLVDVLLRLRRFGGKTTRQGIVGDSAVDPVLRGCSLKLTYNTRDALCKAELSKQGLAEPIEILYKRTAAYFAVNGVEGMQVFPGHSTVMVDLLHSTEWQDLPEQA